MSAPTERERLGNDKVTEVQPTELLDVAGIERRHVQQVYDDIATHFSATRYKAWPRVRAFIESLPRYAAVVDVGCGNGKYFSCAQNFMAATSNAPDDGANEEGQTGPAYRFVAGVDFSERLLRLALNQLDHEASETSPSSSRSLGTRGRTELLLADARRTAFRNGAFDAAISIAVVHHFATHERRLDAVRELLRLVRPDGLILIYVWAKERPEKRPRSGASDVFIRWEMHEAHDPERRVHHRYYHLFGEGELERLVEEAGGVVRESYFDKENWCVVLQKSEVMPAKKGAQQSPLFEVSPRWMQRAAEGIASRNGMLLTDFVVHAEMGEALTIRDMPEHSGIEPAIDQLRQRLLDSVEQAVGETRVPPSGHADDVKERQLFVEVVLRVAITGALVKYYTESYSIKDADDSKGGDDRQERKQWITQLTKDRFALGLLHVFEVFQEVHSMRRTNYQHRQSNTTVGTVGWDTLLLLHFVHRIPCAARDASPGVIDEATGRIVRSWRKLLQSLQVVDPGLSPEFSRRRGALAVCNGLLSILFRRYNVHQCRVLINTIVQAERVTETGGAAGREVLKPAQHMTSEVLTFYYYKGRVALYDHQAREAFAALQQAYQLLPPPGSGNIVQHRNKQRVRFFLTVAGVVSGRMPPEEIQQRDDLIVYIFQPILKAIQRGDPRAFSIAVDAYGPILRRRGVYFILQRAKLLCFLILVARVHATMDACGEDSTRIPLRVLTTMYINIAREGKMIADQDSAARETTERRPKRQRNEDEIDDGLALTDSEMTWWVAKLISTGLLRGYISCEHKVVVLSRQNPFPTLVAGESAAPLQG